MLQIEFYDDGQFLVVAAWQAHASTLIRIQQRVGDYLIPKQRSSWLITHHNTPIADLSVNRIHIKPNARIVNTD